jgi:DNA-binding MarR family transcriptional regulator
MTMRHDTTAEYPLGPALEFLQRLWQFNHALEKLSSQMDKRLGVTAQQRLIVRCVGKYPGMSAGRLASLLHVDPGTVSAALKRMEDKKLIERRVDPRDARRICLGLTAKGRRLDCPIRGTIEGAVERLLDSVPSRNVTVAMSMLMHLTRYLDEETSELLKPAGRANGRTT